MLTGPREALGRSSTFSFPIDRPGWIDMTTRYEGKPEPLHTAAIYTIEGDRLTYCVAPPGQPRPTKFVTRKGDGYTLVSAKRTVKTHSLP